MPCAASSRSSSPRRRQTGESGPREELLRAAESLVAAGVPTKIIANALTHATGASRPRCSPRSWPSGTQRECRTRTVRWPAAAKLRSILPLSPPRCASPRNTRRSCRRWLHHLAAAEIAHATSAADAVKRVKRKLHQLVGAYVDAGLPAPGLLDALSAAGDEVARRQICLRILSQHASTRERLPHIEAFYAAVFAGLRAPHRVMDLACGLNPVARPFMPLPTGLRKSPATTPIGAWWPSRSMPSRASAIQPPAAPGTCSRRRRPWPADIAPATQGRALPAPSRPATPAAG